MISSFLNWFNQKDKNAAGNVAKQRLQLLLVQDRVRLNSEQMEELKTDLLDVLSKYFEIDDDGLEVSLERVPETRDLALVSNIPVKRVIS